MEDCNAIQGGQHVQTSKAYELRESNFPLRLSSISNDSIKDISVVPNISNHAMEKALEYQCNKDLVRLIKVLDNNNYYLSFSGFLEIQAIAYYRLGLEAQAIEKIVYANEISKTYDLGFKPSISILNQKNLLWPTKHKCD